jgi:hypothetical protein
MGFMFFKKYSIPITPPLFAFKQKTLIFDTYDCKPICFPCQKRNKG